MVKFEFIIRTPYESHYNTHYAKTAKRVKHMIDQWNTEFKGTGYSVELVEIMDASNEKLPEGYTCW